MGVSAAAPENGGQLNHFQRIVKGKALEFVFP